MSVPSDMYMNPYASYLSIKQSDLASSIGLSSDKIKSGTTILGITGTLTSLDLSQLGTMNNVISEGNYEN